MFDNDFKGRWLPIELAPENCDLEIGVADKCGVAPSSFPCRRVSGIWFNVWAGEPVLIYPTHWRFWPTWFDRKQLASADHGGDCRRERAPGRRHRPFVIVFSRGFLRVRCCIAKCRRGFDIGQTVRVLCAY